MYRCIELEDAGSVCASHTPRKVWTDTVRVGTPRSAKPVGFALSGHFLMAPYTLLNLISNLFYILLPTSSLSDTSSSLKWFSLPRAGRPNINSMPIFCLRLPCFSFRGSEPTEGRRDIDLAIERCGLAPNSNCRIVCLFVCVQNSGSFGQLLDLPGMKLMKQRWFAKV